MPTKVEKSNAKRLIDLRAALKVAKRNDKLELKALAALWGTSKARFVNKRDEMGEFPDPEVDGNRFLYPAIPTLKAMIAYITRHEADDAHKQQLMERLVSKGGKQSLLQGLPVAELIRMNVLATDIEERERKQRLYIAAAEVERVAGAIFSKISNLLSNLSKRVDPHGRLPASVRKLIDEQASKLLLWVHAEIKGVLKADADNGPGVSKARGARKPRARR